MKLALIIKALLPLTLGCLLSGTATIPVLADRPEESCDRYKACLRRLNNPPTGGFRPSVRTIAANLFARLSP